MNKLFRVILWIPTPILIPDFSKIKYFSLTLNLDWENITISKVLHIVNLSQR